MSSWVSERESERESERARERESERARERESERARERESERARDEREYVENATVHRPPSTVHRPPSTVHRPPSTDDADRNRPTKNHHALCLLTTQVQLLVADLDFQGFYLLLVIGIQSLLLLSLGGGSHDRNEREFQSP